MRIRRAHERKLRPDLYLERTIPHPPKQFARSLHQLVPRRDVIIERRPSEKERPLAVEYLWIEWWNWATRLPEQGQDGAD